MRSSRQNTRTQQRETILAMLIVRTRGLERSRLDPLVDQSVQVTTQVARNGQGKMSIQTSDVTCMSSACACDHGPDGYSFLWDSANSRKEAPATKEERGTLV